MHVIEYIRLDMAGMYRPVKVTMKDMTPELFNGAMPGPTNTISATFVHFVNVYDNFILMAIKGNPSAWESGS